MHSGPLRVGLDGHAFNSPAGGVRRYVTELTTALGQIDPEVAILALGASPGTPLPTGVAAVPANSWLPTNLGWCVDGLPRAVRRTALDLFHAPAYTAPLWGAHPLVVTIHDVSYERHPEWYPYRDDRMRRWFYRRSALTGDMIITDSEFSRKEIEAAYGIGPDRIRVVPLGVGPPFTPAAEPTHRRPPEDPFVLHVGDLHPRRNIGVLVDALVLLRARADALKRTTLVLVGTDRGSAAAIAERAKTLGVSDAVRFVTGTGDGQVIELMRRASVFAYPSLYEGFGLPVLEAMACGAPVVSSSAASMPEVAGGAGLLVDPHDVRGWYEGLAAVLGSSERAGALRAAGVARAAGFTWKKTATLTLEAYRLTTLNVERRRRPARDLRS